MGAVWFSHLRLGQGKKASREVDTGEFIRRGHEARKERWGKGGE